jgi:hypothetical protein
VCPPKEGASSPPPPPCGADLKSEAKEEVRKSVARMSVAPTLPKKPREMSASALMVCAPRAAP